MIGRSVGIITACALGASAFLLPPGIDTESNDKTDIAVSVLNPKHQIIELPCSSCAFPPKQEEVTEEGEDDLFFIQGGANNLLLNFSISEDGQALELNGQAIYPPHFHRETFLERHMWSVEQIAASTSRQEIEAGNYKGTPLRITGSGLKVAGENPVSPNGDMLVPIRWHLFSLEDQPMTVDEVSIKLLKMDNGELLILELSPAQGPSDMAMDFPFGIPSPPGPEFHRHGPPKDCNMLPAPLCRFKNMLESKIQGMKDGKFGGCTGRKGGPPNKLPSHIKGPHFGPHGLEGGRPEHHHGRPPHHMRPHGHHGHHHRHHFMHAFAKGLVAVLIPVMAGIAVGMTVSLVGLLVGRAIAFLWIKFARGGKRGYASVAQDELTAEEGDMEKEADEEAPPMYENAPSYEEVEKEQR